VLIHNGGGITVGATLAAGRPQLAIPLYLEQSLTGRALERLGVGKSIEGSSRPRQVVDALRELLDKREYADRAMAFARTIADRAYRGSLTGIIERCEACVC
jgi:UDP:flavonoid glycosyltransferase YjiC (YdhE family)